MSRVAKAPVVIPKGVEIQLEGSKLTVKGPRGALSILLHDDVEIEIDVDEVRCCRVNREKNIQNYAQVGTARALIANMVKGVTDSFEKKLTLVGVGYRAQVQGQILTMSLGFSHPIVYQVDPKVTIACPSATEINLSSIDKGCLGQVAADIRAFRPPEPYKGKGVRYADETVRMKEAKKK